MSNTTVDLFATIPLEIKSMIASYLPNNVRLNVSVNVDDPFWKNALRVTESDIICPWYTVRQLTKSKCLVRISAALLQNYEMVYLADRGPERYRIWNQDYPESSIRCKYLYLNHDNWLRIFRKMRLLSVLRAIIVASANSSYKYRDPSAYIDSRNLLIIIIFVDTDDRRQQLLAQNFCVYQLPDSLAVCVLKKLDYLHENDRCISYFSTIADIIGLFHERHAHQLTQLYFETPVSAAILNPLLCLKNVNAKYRAMDDSEFLEKHCVDGELLMNKLIKN